MAKIKGIDKLIKARSSLLLSEPAYGVPALSLRLVPVENDPILWAMGTDGENLYFNPDWIESATLDEIKGVIIHEIWHLWSKHDIRKGVREHMRWNYAADAAINPNIRSAGYRLPENTIGDQYKGQAAEEIYAKLPQNGSVGSGKIGIGTGGKGQSPWDVGHVKQNAGIAQGKNPRDVESERNVQISNWYQNAKRAGKVPAELERIVGELMKHRMPWREILARFVDTFARNDYNWAKCDSEYARYGVYMPSVESEELGLIAYIGDTSGSIDEKQHRIAVSELQGMLRAFDNAEILAMWVDHALHNPEYIRAEDVPLNIHPKGGGGTSFRPGFKYMQDKDILPNCVVYATDGYCDDYPDDPGVPVLWLVIEKNKEFNPPWGEVCQCDFD